MALTGGDEIATLSSYVPQAVLRYLATNAERPTEPHAERAAAALLLIDISGFTPITATATGRGPQGTEELSRAFNAYLGQIIDLIWEHGGDIAKIVGDALIPQWLATDEDLPNATRRAAACALAIGELGDYVAPLTAHLVLRKHRKCLSVVFLQLTILFFPSCHRQWLKRCADSRSAKPNLYAPHLYADSLDFEATLVNLPGIRNKQSYWELSYQLYFVPEDKYYEALKRGPQGPSNPTPEEFPGRILLAKGHKKKMRASTPEQRTISLSGVSFKQRVPDAQRTKFAHLLTAYSVKIFDARLNTTVYYSGIFLTEPYQDDEKTRRSLARRST